MCGTCGKVPAAAFLLSITYSFPSLYSKRVRLLLRPTFKIFTTPRSAGHSFGLRHVWEGARRSICCLHHILLRGGGVRLRDKEKGEGWASLGLLARGVLGLRPCGACVHVSASKPRSSRSVEVSKFQTFRVWSFKFPRWEVAKFEVSKFQSLKFQSVKFEVSRCEV